MLVHCVNTLVETFQVYYCCNFSKYVGNTHTNVTNGIDDQYSNTNKNFQNKFTKM